MSDAPALLLALGAGLAAGVGFYLGLWWTVRRLPSSGHPGLLAFGGLAARMALCLPVFWLLARGGNWQRALAGLAGFVVARFAVLRLTRRPEAAG